MFCFYDDDSDDIHRERQMNGSVSFREEMTREDRFFSKRRKRERTEERKKEREKKKVNKAALLVIVVPR